tara:strand:- start:99 stop:482 length:384 start_codon:yes stop_codon:yes gene_type:complete
MASKLDPVTLILSIGILVGTAAGFGAGWGLKPDASLEAMSSIQESNVQMLDAVQKVALEEQETEKLIADKLTDVPPQCLPELGGDPLGLQCQWAWCVRTGETEKQRCEVTKLTDELIEYYQSDSDEQ